MDAPPSPADDAGVWDETATSAYRLEDTSISRTSLRESGLPPCEGIF